MMNFKSVYSISILNVQLYIKIKSFDQTEGSTVLVKPSI